MATKQRSFNDATPVRACVSGEHAKCGTTTTWGVRGAGS
ncbi:hypothetical protein E1A91_D06G119500v1 [Gossypium mustelinum]|uniref:Uncharacterized protein n=1 Tax=Gossypium mustelinum TaxID=34275 RepID=A0A5D2UHJ7_GOSMU|nr:hypothetical protein E1A91_D06G119500v1 [Gossypium mustelinum]